ncbi:MAG: hypothetical protein ABH872_06670 [Candidatus Omnitrophota bacterium]
MPAGLRFPTKIETYLILGMYFAIGAVLGYALARKPLQKANSVTVDIVKDGNQIDIYEHYSGELKKQVDAAAYPIPS